MKFGYRFPLSSFASMLFLYYNIYASKLYPNGWTKFAFLKKFMVYLGEEPSLNMFRYCYSLIGNANEVRVLALLNLYSLA
jgi:hypothetical protein